MNKLLDWLKNLFGRTEPPPENSENSEQLLVHPFSTRFLNLEKLEEDPNIGFDALKKSGETNGRMNRPGPDFHSLDLVEADVVEEFSKRWQNRLNAYVDEVSDWKNELHQVDPSLLGSDQKTNDPIEDHEIEHGPLVGPARDQMKNEIANAEAKLVDATRDCRRGKERYESFKKEHSVEEDVTVYPWWGSVGLVLLLIAFVVAETLINGEFFAAQLEGAKNPSRFQAALISTVNVVFFAPFIMACWRYKSHDKQAYKYVARLGLVLVGLTALIFNLGAAHYRDAFSDQHPASDDPCYREVGDAASVQELLPAISEEALCLFREHFFVLSGFDSYGFLALGLAFVFFGIVDWIHVFPGYPGQQKRRRRWSKAEKNLAKKKLELSNALKRTRNHYVAVLNSNHQSMVSLINKMENRHAELHNYSRELTRRCRRHLDVYRTSNQLFRKDMTTVPKHWSSEWEPAWEIPEAPGGLDLSSRKVAQWIDRLDHIRERKNEYVSNLYRDHIRHVDQLTAVQDTQS